MTENERERLIIDGIQAGGAEAIKKARQTDTKLVIWRDGQVVHVFPDEAEALANEKIGQDQ